MIKLPYIKQINPNACGAAVLEMIYKHYGKHDISQVALMTKYMQLEPHGSGNYMITTDNLVDDARARGFEAVWLRANYNNPKDCLSLLKIFVEIKKIPVIVCQKFTTEMPQIGHFRIVLGLDESQVYFHDPRSDIEGANLSWPHDKFIEFWQPTGQNVTGGILCIILPSI